MSKLVARGQLIDAVAKMAWATPINKAVEAARVVTGRREYITVAREGCRLAEDGPQKGNLVRAIRLGRILSRLGIWDDTVTSQDPFRSGVIVWLGGLWGSIS